MKCTIDAAILNEFFTSICLDEYNVVPTPAGWKVEGIDQSQTIYQNVFIQKAAFTSYEDGEIFRILNHTLLKKMLNPFEGLVEVTIDKGELNFVCLTRTATVPLGNPEEQHIPVPKIPYQFPAINVPKELLRRASNNADLIGSNRIVFSIAENILQVHSRSKKGHLVETLPVFTMPRENTLQAFVQSIFPCLHAETIEVFMEEEMPFTLHYTNDAIDNTFCIAHMSE